MTLTVKTQNLSRMSNDLQMSRQNKNSLTEVRFPSSRIIDLARQGDATSIGQIFEKYHQGIFQYLYYHTGDQPSAEDLTSEVFIRMLKGLPHYQFQKDSFQGWLYSIARNIAIDHSRKVKSHPPVPLSETMRSRIDDPENEVEGKLTSQILRSALEKLNPDQRDVIILRIVVGLTIEETARALKKSVDAVKGLQRRALVGLKQVLLNWKIEYD
jgi:RNA polymerase sigma-70 factor (ECF subfamily)